MTENCKLPKAILSAFYNISQRNFGILLILWCSFKLWWNFCLDQNLVYYANGQFRASIKLQSRNIIIHACLILILVHICRFRLVWKEYCTSRCMQHYIFKILYNRIEKFQVYTSCNMWFISSFWTVYIYKDIYIDIQSRPPSNIKLHAASTLPFVACNARRLRASSSIPMSRSCCTSDWNKQRRTLKEEVALELAKHQARVKRGCY
jgi:hypothetical protein